MSRTDFSHDRSITNITTSYRLVAKQTLHRDRAQRPRSNNNSPRSRRLPVPGAECHAVATRGEAAACAAKVVIAFMPAYICAVLRLPAPPLKIFAPMVTVIVRLHGRRRHPCMNAYVDEQKQVHPSRVAISTCHFLYVYI